MMRILLVVMLASKVAHAEVDPENPTAPTPPRDDRSPTLALSLTTATTAAGLAMITTDRAPLAGYMLVAIGPSTGYWYGETSSSAWVLRLLGGLAYGYGVSHSGCFVLCPNYTDVEKGFMYGGAGLSLLGAAIDIARVRGAVIDRNRERAASPRISVAQIDGRVGLTLATSF